MGNNHFLHIKDISKRFRNFEALKNISFDIDQGEVFGFIGPNGAGKTTTIKIIVGLIRDFTGEYHIDGMKMPDNYEDLYKFVGYMPQDPAFQDWRTMRHVLTTFGKLSGLTSDRIESNILEITKLLNISEFMNKKVSQLSGGTLQKLGLAQALIHNPKLLLLDEPLSGLDPESRKQVKEMIREMSSRGVTVVFSSHILSDVQDVADKIGIINRGVIKAVMTLSELEKEFRATGEIRVHFSNDAGKQDNITALPFVNSMTKNSDLKYSIDLIPETDQAEAIHKLMGKLNELGYKILSIAPAAPDLDELYLKYVKGGS